MKKNLFIIWSLLIIFAACKSGDAIEKPVVTLSQSSISTTSAASSTTLSVTSNYDWKLSSDQTWCVPSVTSGKAGVATNTTVTIGANTTSTARTANLNFTVEEAIVNSAPCTQAAEEHYKLPVIFHVLYHSTTDSLQNVTQAQLSKIITAVNKLYSSNNMNLEFTLATTDPNGKTLAEAGIDRQYISTDSLDCDKFMNGDLADNTKYVNMLWNLNNYINVFLYQFKTDASGYTTMGITDLPYVRSSKKLDGLQVGDYYLAKGFDYPQCSSINSLYIYEFDPASQYYNPYDVSVTIAHELGHYLGLDHVFTEVGETQCSGTDYCDDTPNYDRNTYEKWLLNYLDTHKNISSMKELVPRTNCETGESFDGHNIMDYEYCYSDQFTTNQRERVRFVLNYGLFIPGTKLNSTSTIQSSKTLNSLTRPDKIYKSIGNNIAITKLLKSRGLAK